MADDAPGRSTKLAMSRHVAGDTADDGPLDAALGVHGGRESEGNRECESRRQNPSHVRSPIVKDLQANQSGRTLFRSYRASCANTSPNRLLSLPIWTCHRLSWRILATGSYVAEIVDFRPQVVRCHVDRRKRDGQPEALPARASWIQVEHAVGCVDLRYWE
jgi:hypothetical protein